MSFLQGTIADNTPKPPLTETQLDRLIRKDRQRRKANVIHLARKKKRCVGRAIRAFELKERIKSRC